MDAFIDKLSMRPVEDLARQSSGVAYNEGRGAEILSQHEQGNVEHVVRSEVLDDNTCAACAALDGMVVRVDSPDFKALQPPAQCFGGNRCRGFYIAIGERG